MRQIGGIVLLADGVCLCALVYFTKQIFPLGYISAVLGIASVLIQIRTPPLNFRSAPISSPVVRGTKRNRVRHASHPPGDGNGVAGDRL